MLIKAVTQHVDTQSCPLVRQCRHGRASAVVEIKYRGLERVPVKQPRLGAPVVRHRAVVIEMIASEVGEQRHIELDAGHAPLFQSMRRNFHRHCACAFAIPLAQLAVQPRRIGRSVDACFQRIGKSVTQRARHRAMPAQMVERLGDPLAARGFAVGAGHTHHP